MNKEQELRPCPLCRKTMQLAQFSDWEELDLPVQHIVHPVPTTCPLAGVQIEATSENIAAWNRRDEQAEVVGYVTREAVEEVAAGRLGNYLAPKGTYRPENEVPVYASPPAVAAGGVTEEMVPIKYVTLGRGEWVAGTYMRDDMPSLCFGPAPEPKAPGEKPTDEVSEWATRNGAVVISFANLNAAMQMLDLVRDAIDLKAIPLPTPPSRGEGE